MSQEQITQLVAELRWHGSNVLLKRETDAADLIETLARRASSAEKALERVSTAARKLADSCTHDAAFMSWDENALAECRAALEEKR